MASSQSYAVLNAFARDKLGQVLARVLDKMAANVRVEILETSGYRGADARADRRGGRRLQRNLPRRRHVRQVDRNLLLSRGVDDGVVSAVEKTWGKRGRSLAAQFAAFQAAETPALALQKTDWRLHLEMGSSKRSGQSQPTAIFQLELEDTSSTETERLDVELSHAELRSLFLQLNAIQAELDAPPTPSAA
ncbi:COMM domain [Phytophthora cactorum]|nr:COMM domain [Phytophthora cactorum]